MTDFFKEGFMPNVFMIYHSKKEDRRNLIWNVSKYIKEYTIDSYNIPYNNVKVEGILEETGFMYSKNKKDLPDYDDYEKYYENMINHHKSYGDWSRLPFVTEGVDSLIYFFNYGRVYYDYGSPAWHFFNPKENKPQEMEIFDLACTMIEVLRDFMVSWKDLGKKEDSFKKNVFDFLYYESELEEENESLSINDEILSEVKGLYESFATYWVGGWLGVVRHGLNVKVNKSKSKDLDLLLDRCRTVQEFCQEMGVNAESLDEFINEKTIPSFKEEYYLGNEEDETENDSPFTHIGECYYTYNDVLYYDANVFVEDSSLPF